MNSFGIMLKRCREQAGLTQEQLAEKLDVSIVAVQNWENGKNKVRIEKLEKLSYLFNIPLDTLICEMIKRNSEKTEDNFPYFLFDEQINEIIRTLHLSLSQQELFGILYIYQAEFLEHMLMDSANLRDDLKMIPYEFVHKFGSINLLNIAEGLYHVLKYIRTDFLIRVLRINPEKEFDVRHLPKELICEFIDSGYKPLDESDFDVDSEKALYFNINMNNSRKILPYLEKESIRLADNEAGNHLAEDVPDWVITYFDNVPDYLKCRRNEISDCLLIEEWDRHHSPIIFLGGIEQLVNCRKNDNHEWILSINEMGKELLAWFKDKN